jgi:hypothetical protein
VKKMERISEKDIPCLWEDWKKACTDIMQGPPSHLPLLREINHKILLLDKKKQYNYHLSCCPESVRKPLAEKIRKYTHAG